MYETDQETNLFLVKRAKKGSTEAFAELYEQIYIDLYRFALYTMGHKQDAEDAVSETVIAAYENLPQLRNEKAFHAWIFKILVNICNKKLRQKVERPIEERPEESEHPDDAQAYDVKNAFQELSEEEREIVGLTVFGGYTSLELGQMLGINSNTVRSKRSRALDKLSKKLKF